MNPAADASSTTRANRLGPSPARHVAAAMGATALVAVAAFGCGSSAGETSTDALPANAQRLRVYSGPSELPSSAVNIPYTDVTICVPGTTQCQTIHDVEIDTGSIGLRLLASEVNLTLPAVQSGSGGTLAECTVFADTSYVWGPIVSADIQLGSETAPAAPVQLIGPSGFFGAPQSCGTSGQSDDTIPTLGARGILGLGVFAQDCGLACTDTVSATALPDIYYNCQTTGGVSGCTRTAVPLANQMQNPVGLLPKNNNGVLVSLPAITELGAASVEGALYFGIGTQENNSLGGAGVYTVNGYGYLSTTYAGTTFSGINGSTLDTGTTIFLAPLSLPACADADKIFCPATTQQFTAKNTGSNGLSTNVSFSIANAETLVQTNHAAFNDVGGNFSTFLWGLPFFYGRNVFVGIEGHPSPGGIGPFLAY